MSLDSNLYLVGAPLNEDATFTPDAVATLNKCTVVFAEQKKVFEKQSKRSGLSLIGKEIIYLDNLKDYRDIEKDLLSRKNVEAALLSDTGMPVLFDPGNQILKLCRKLKFQIHSVPTATSWATAACISGYQPPFLLEGFLPQEKEARKARMSALKNAAGHKILMETPYRYSALLNEIKELHGDKTPVFLAWEIASPAEFNFWGSVSELIKISEQKNLKKGEFVLILEDARIRS